MASPELTKADQDCLGTPKLASLRECVCLLLARLRLCTLLEFGRLLSTQLGLLPILAGLLVPTGRGTARFTRHRAHGLRLGARDGRGGRANRPVVREIRRLPTLKPQASRPISV